MARKLAWRHSPSGRTVSLQHARLACLVLATAFCMAFAGCTKRTPQQQLYAAIVKGDVPAVKRLLDDTSNVTANWPPDGKGETVLGVAAAEGNPEIVQLLLQYGADPNFATIEKMTPLQTAAYHGNLQIARLLVDAGADLNVADARHGLSPLMNAAFKGHADVAKLLLERGADRDARTPDGRTASDIARRAGHLDVYWVIERKAESASNHDG